MFQEDGVVPGGFVGSLLAREEAEERRLQVLQDPWESRKHINLGIHLCYNSDILKHQFDIDLETCLRVLRSIHSMISMYSRCCKLLVVALLRVTVRQEDCVDWLRQHGAKDVGLVGHSRGGVTISQLEGDFCRVTWMTWILKAMVLAEFRDPIHPIRIWGEHRWISTTSSRSWRYIQKRSGRTHADHLWCRRRDLYSPSIVDGLCCMDAIELSNLCSTFLKYPRFFKCFECVDLLDTVFICFLVFGDLALSFFCSRCKTRCADSDQGQRASTPLAWLISTCWIRRWWNRGKACCLTRQTCVPVRPRPLQSTLDWEVIEIENEKV